jgi:pyruvate,water dikinase
MNLLINKKTSTNNGQLGGKAGALAELSGAGFNVPPAFVIEPQIFYKNLTSRQRIALESASTAEGFQNILANINLKPGFQKKILAALAKLGANGDRFAVRSSAPDEDSAQHSFAGQLESFLFVSTGDVPRRVLDVWRSAFTDRVCAYRSKNHLPPVPSAPAVLIQRMINPEVSGVAFSADPVTGQRGITVVASLYGVGTGIVSGECDADTHYVDRDGHIIDHKIAVKTNVHQFSPLTPSGVRSVRLTDKEAHRPVLNNPQVLAIAALVRKVDRFFCRPQDIEWAIEDGKIYLLQSRPITSLYDVADPDGIPCIWDNSNIAESYGGITTPLTFSFARRAYEGVYRQFCRTLRVSRKTIEKNDSVFRNMIGLIRGQIYYNLLNWYRLLAMLPGYKLNRAFMEQMMGVKERLSEKLHENVRPSRWWERMLDLIHLLSTLAGVIANYFLLDRRIKRFYQRLHNALSANGSDLSKFRAEELVAVYKELENRLLNKWDSPIVNDFFAMIFYGLLKKLSVAWCRDTEGTLQNDLLRNAGGMISTEPAERVSQMAGLAAKDPELVEILNTDHPHNILEKMRSYPEFQSLYESYLQKFGERCMNELKLESATLHEDPQMLLRAIGSLAKSHTTKAPTRHGSRAEDIDLRKQAEDRVASILSRHPMRWLAFRWVLKNARNRVCDRENLRFERTRAFGRVRKIVVEIGRRFYGLNLLDDPRDIFYLELQEIFAFVEGTSTSTNLKDLVALRKQEFKGFSRMQAPADRFETRGIVYQGNRHLASRPNNDASGNMRKGIGCCPGTISGRVRVVRDPRESSLKAGEILVADRTDPSWILLFPLASGLLVERGSLLSHSAIVAREMGIPAIVSIPGVTGWLEDGDWVELDGRTGMVKKIDIAKEESNHVQRS